MLGKRTLVLGDEAYKASMRDEGARSAEATLPVPNPAAAAPASPSTSSSVQAHAAPDSEVRGVTAEARATASPAAEPAAAASSSPTLIAEQTVQYTDTAWIHQDYIRASSTLRRATQALSNAEPATAVGGTGGAGAQPSSWSANSAGQEADLSPPSVPSHNSNATPKGEAHLYPIASDAEEVAREFDELEFPHQHSPLSPPTPFPWYAPEAPAGVAPPPAADPEPALPVPGQLGLSIDDQAAAIAALVSGPVLAHGAPSAYALLEQPARDLGLPMEHLVVVIGAFVLVGLTYHAAPLWRQFLFRPPKAGAVVNPKLPSSAETLPPGFSSSSTSATSPPPK